MTQNTPNVKPTNAFLSYYIDHNLDLIPLKKEGSGAGKAPSQRQWPSARPLTAERAAHRLKHGANIGWRIGAGHLVIDVDPRNGGDESLALLAERLGATRGNLIMSAPTVESGGGGLHLYYRLPESYGRTLRAGLRGLPGLDFKSGTGSQVVIAGSVHPTAGRLYFPHLDSPWPEGPPLAPAALLELLDAGAVRREGEPAAPDTVAEPELYGLADDTEIRKLLGAVDPRDLADYDEWIAEIGAIHHATAGRPGGLEAAIEWSSRDPEYEAEAEAAVTRKWTTFSHSSRPRTIRSILAHVRRAHAEAPSSATRAATDIAERLERRVLVAEFGAPSEAFDALIQEIDLLPPSAKGDRKAINSILERIVAIDSETQAEDAIKALRHALGVSVGVLRQDVRKIRRNIEKAAKSKKKNRAYWVDLIIRKTLATYYSAPDAGPAELGDHLVFAPNAQYYRYSAGSWSVVPTHDVEAACAEMIDARKADGAEIELDTPALAQTCERGIRQRRTVATTALYARERPPSCVNVTNGTLWLDGRTGAARLAEHAPGDYLTSKLPLRYDPAATCPAFDTMLKQVFERVRRDYDETERDELIRHFWEFVGYTLQPNKDIPTVAIWTGPGRNGKSKITEIISQLLGPEAILPTKINEFTKNGNNHATASVEGKLLLLDDDVEINTILNDGVLKKFSETKLIEVNPKNKPAYNVTSTVTPLLLCNNRIRLRDLSYGMRRRLDVIHWGSDLTHLAGSPLPRIAQEAEGAGILNRALAGLVRLRQRGGFSPPACSRQFLDAFFAKSNTVAQWYYERCALEFCESSPVEVIYVDYVDHIQRKNEGRPESESNFVAILEQLGHEHDTEKGIVANLVRRGVMMTRRSA